MPPLLGRRPALLLRLGFLVLFLVFLVYASFFAKWRPHGLLEIKEELELFGPAAPVVAVGFQAAGVVLLIPGFLLVLATALLFGFDAIWISVLGQSLGAVLAYLVARHLGRDILEAALGQRLLALERALESHGFRTLLLLRLATVLPGPFLVYAPGLVSVPLRHVVAAALVGDLPFITVLTIAGTLLADVRDPAQLVELRFLLPLSLLAVVLSTPVTVFLIVRARRRRSRKAAAAPAPPVAAPTAEQE